MKLSSRVHTVETYFKNKNNKQKVPVQSAVIQWIIFLFTLKLLNMFLIMCFGMTEWMLHGTAAKVQK